MNTTDIAWIAGLLEGEGSFYWRNSNSAKISCAMTDLDVLNKLQTLAGGHIYATKKQQPHHKDAWVWTLSGRTALDLMIEISPHMGSRRLKKIAEILTQYEAYQFGVQAKNAEHLIKCRGAATDYLDGKGSLRTIAKQYGISYVTVKNYADALHNARCDWDGLDNPLKRTV